MPATNTRCIKDEFDVVLKSWRVPCELKYILDVYVDVWVCVYWNPDGVGEVGAVQFRN